MAKKEVCDCDHVKTDHTRVLKNYVGMFGPCEFDTCDCKQFINRETKKGSTYTKNPNNIPKVQISNLTTSGKINTQLITCKKCNRKITTARINQHNTVHQKEIKLAATK